MPRGIYKRTKEELIRLRTQTIGIHHTSKTKRRMSASAKRAWADGKHDNDRHVGMLGKHHSLKSRIKMSKAHLGKKKKPLTEEHKQKISSTKKKLIMSGKIKLDNIYSWGVGGYRKDLGHYCRSRWEANYARYLKYKGIKYQYEPERFWLEKLGCSYLPDFKLETGEYVEVKGRDKTKAVAKRRAFREQYRHKLIVIGPKRYHRIMSDNPTCRTE